MRPHEKDQAEIKNVKERDIKLFSEEDQKLYANKFFKDERNLERILTEEFMRDTEQNFGKFPFIARWQQNTPREMQSLMLNIFMKII